MPPCFYPDQTVWMLRSSLSLLFVKCLEIWCGLFWHGEHDYIIITLNIAVIITAGRLFALTGFGFDYEIQSTVFQKMCSEIKSSEKRLKKNFGIMKYSSHHQNCHNNIRHGCKKNWPSCVKFVLICLPKVHLGRGSNNRDWCFIKKKQQPIIHQK